MRQPGVILGRYSALRQQTEQMARDAQNAPVNLGRMLRRRIRYNEKRMIAIRREIETIRDPIARMILIYRYLDGMTFDQISNKMYISERHVYRLHRAALQELSARREG